MRVDATTVVVVGALKAAGIRSILLKGPSIARWLYSAKKDRRYVDCDLLVAPTDLRAAEDVLTGLGFTPFQDQIRWDPRHHAHPWLPPEDFGAGVDLHQSIGEVTAEPERVWAVLSRETEEMEINNETVEVLNLPARALHVAAHAAHHDGGSPTALEDLRRAIAAFPIDGWRRAAELARDIGGVAELTHGLELVPEGAVLRNALGLAPGRGLDAILREGGAPPLARGVGWMLDQPTLTRRVVFAIRNVFPSPPEMRQWARFARRGPLWLALAYAVRPFWVVWRLPRAWATARRARASEQVHPNRAPGNGPGRGA